MVLSAAQARAYAPDVEEMREKDAERAWSYAAAQDTENVPFKLQPMLGAYRL